MTRLSRNLTATFCDVWNVRIWIRDYDGAINVEGLGVKLHLSEGWIWARVRDGWHEEEFLTFIAQGIRAARSHPELVA